MTIREIIQRIQSANSRGVHSDDSRLTNRHIYNKLLTVRSFLLGRMLKSKRKISSWNYSVLPCVRVIELPPNESCPCVVPKGCNVYRTEHTIPRPMMTLSDHKIQSVTDISRNIIIDPIAATQVKNLRGNKFSTKNIRYFIENGYIYFTSNMKLDLVKVVLVAEDLVQANSFKSACDNGSSIDCISILDTEFNIDSELLEPLVQLTYEELVTAYSQARPDTDNNTFDTALNPSRVSPKQSQDEEQQQQQ